MTGIYLHCRCVDFGNGWQAKLLDADMTMREAKIMFVNVNLDDVNPKMKDIKKRSDRNRLTEAELTKEPPLPEEAAEAEKGKASSSGAASSSAKEKTS